jgi:hypothetical protein
MQKTLSLDQKIQDWFETHKGVTISAFFGVMFFLLRYFNRSDPVIVLMETILLTVLFVGMMIFVYNFAYVVLMLTVDEGLNEEERILLKWMLRRAVLISGGWFITVLALFLFLDDYPFILVSANCFLLSGLFYFIRKGENPLTEGTAI